MIDFLSRLDGIYSNEYNLIYIPVLKNAHSWGKQFFSHNFNCNEKVYIGSENINLYKDKKFVVILRDPIERWISAVTQYLLNFDNPVEMLDNPVIFKLITDGIVLDVHAIPQRHDLIGLDDSKTIFFMCDENLERNVNLFSLAFYKKPTESVGNYNRHIDNEQKTFLYPKIKNMVLQDSTLLNKLKEFYLMDYALIAHVKSRTINGSINKFTFRDMYGTR